MPAFVYSARPTTGGDIQSGEIELKTKEEVLSYLHKQKLIPVSVREKPKQLSFKIGTGISTKDIVIFTRQFATMINAGLPLVQSLDILAEQTENQYLRKSIQDVLYDVESGHTLADAMGKHPRVFTELYVNMVAAGEAGGILDIILLRLATFLEKNDALIRKIKGAMIYPAVIFAVAISAVAILLIFVIPTFQQMFDAAGIALPLPTRIVIAMSAFLQGYWWAVGIGLVGAGFALRATYRTGNGRLAIDRMLLRFPIMGDLLRKASAREIVTDRIPDQGVTDEPVVEIDPRLLDALDELSERQRSMVLMRHVVGMSGAEIASVVGLNRAAVYAVIRRAERKLRESVVQEEST